jgi:pimeloyl-ACP methyl ester carboxylesterase
MFSNFPRFILVASALSIALLTPSFGADGIPDVETGAYLKPQAIGVLPDGRKVNFLCMGKGTPIAIIEPGWGGVPFEWRKVQPEFAKVTKVCFFERPGYGFSDPGPLPRDSAADVVDLHDGLVAAGLAPPYVLVSASLGGFDVRLFAYSHPREVAGLLIQDPPAEQIYVQNPDPDEDVDGLRRCIAIAKQRPLINGGPEHCINTAELGPEWPATMKAKTFADNSRASFLTTLLSEDLSMVDQSTKEIIAARRKLGRIPLILLQADTDCDWKGRTPHNEGERFDKFRCALLADQVRDSTRGERRIVEGAGHSVYDDKPLVVIATFKEIVDAARRSQATAADR